VPLPRGVLRPTLEDMFAEAFALLESSPDRLWGDSLIQAIFNARLGLESRLKGQGGR
jgi:hypothetical protein